MQPRRFLFLDLDDTIFRSDIPYESFSKLFDILDEVNEVLPANELPKVKQELYNQTFGKVAKRYAFTPRMIRAYFSRMEQLSFEFNISPFSDYSIIQSLNLPKYLVTSGSRIIQQAKIDSLGIAEDFASIHFDDPFAGSNGKQGIFKLLLDEIPCNPNEALVIGDNPDAEIHAARMLNIPYVLIDRKMEQPFSASARSINGFEHISHFL